MLDAPTMLRPIDLRDPLDARALMIVSAARAFVRASRGDEVSAAAWLEELEGCELWTPEEQKSPLFVAQLRDVLRYAIDRESECTSCEGTGETVYEYALNSAAEEPSYEHVECEDCNGRGEHIVTLVDEPRVAA